MVIRILVILSFTQILNAQIPQDFEFLYHDNQSSQLGVKHIVDDGVLFVAHNSTNDMTVVALAKNDNTQEVLFSTIFSGRSKKVITQDSAIHILLYDLFDYDVGVPGFYDVIYQNGEVEIMSFSYEDSSEISDLKVNHISLDALGNYILEDGNNRLITFNVTTILDEVQLDFRVSGIYKSFGDKTYVYSTDKVFLFENDQLNEILATERIYDMQVLDSFNAILVEGQINLFDNNFELINTFQINSSIKDLNRVSFVDSTLCTLTNENGELIITSFDWNGDKKQDAVDIGENEDATVIHYLSEDNYLLFGGVNFPVVKNIFFRHVDILNGNTYENIDVQILDYQIFQTGKDSFVNFVDEMTNDTSWWITYLYDLSFNLINNTNGEIFSASVFHSVLFNTFGPTPLKLYELDSSLVNNESREILISDESFGPLQNLKNMQLILPGANHRFNIVDNIVTLPDFKSDVTNLELNTTLEIFPNPTHNFLNISSEKSISLVVIYNIQGQLVLTQYKKDGVRKIDVSNLDSGQYYLKTDNYVSKFIKQ